MHYLEEKKNKKQTQPANASFCLSSELLPSPNLKTHITKI
jgi:hypothetical protein